MAGNVVKYSWSQATKRRLATQTAIKPATNGSPAEVVSTLLPNKLIVSSLDLCGPLSRVSVFFRCGPRHETIKNRGVSHVIRSMTGFSTHKSTGFAVIRNLQQNGIHLTCTGDREITGFHVVTARDKLECALKFLSPVAGLPAFKPWEVKDNIPRLEYEIGSLTPQARLIDILHKAAFRTGLGNSLFVKKDFIGTHTSEMLLNFFQEGFTANRAAVVGFNVNQNILVEFAKSLELHCNDPIQGNSKYYGGEIRKDKNSYFSHVAVATQGAGLQDIKEILVHSVLQYAYGAEPVVAWGGSPSPLYKAIHPVAPDAGVSFFSVNYSDTGLFGFVVSSSATTAGNAVEEAFKILKTGSVSEADVKRAKALVKIHILSGCENSENLMEDIAIQSLYGGVIIPGPVLAEAVDKITVSDVNAAAKKIANQKFTLAAFGNLDHIPYLDNLS